MRRMLVVLACAASAVLLGFGVSASAISPAAADEQPAPGRTLAIAPTFAQDNSFGAAMRLARQAGATAVPLSWAWDELETAPGRYEPSQNWMPTANQFFPSIHMSVVLCIKPIDTNNDRRPADLKGRPWDDPELIARYNRLLDWVFPQIPDLSLACFSVGNEIDGILGTDARQWEQYERFFRAAAEHARALRPGLIVGAKVMYPGLTGPAAAYARSLNAHADAVLVTYYPMERGFSVKDPAVVHADWDRLCAAYEGRPIYMLEAGYPSSAVCGSSEEKQAEFVRQLFGAWDEHAGQVRMLCYFCLTDFDPAAVEKYQDYYRGHDRRFAAFLGTLGLRTWPGKGQDKQAWTVFRAEAARRGFGAGG